MKDVTRDLPAIVARHVAACNAHDAEAWMATFLPDALVNDNRRDFAGAAAIRAWADVEMFGDKVTMAVEEAYDNHGDVVVHAKMDGTYDKADLPDPLILSFYFSLRDGLISQLIIIHNRPKG
jgi:ketosteroid isomerase-like protein